MSNTERARNLAEQTCDLVMGGLTQGMYPEGFFESYNNLVNERTGEFPDLDQDYFEEARRQLLWEFGVYTFHLATTRANWLLRKPAEGRTRPLPDPEALRAFRDAYAARLDRSFRALGLAELPDAAFDGQGKTLNDRVTDGTARRYVTLDGSKDITRRFRHYVTAPNYAQAFGSIIALNLLPYGFDYIHTEALCRDYSTRLLALTNQALDTALENERKAGKEA
ncbi:MAG: hypothetical protein QME76_02050 [Bacillota bacterium]|nr:hypothetical protein [Bacillota bacterium]